jgi:DNA-binding transcriptional LysR family regulator
MDISSLRLFLRIADLGSVSAAARDQSLSPASASARLAKLEEVVGFRLFNRTTRAVSLTTDNAGLVRASAHYSGACGVPGTPSTPDEIPTHRCVVLAEYNKWKFKDGNVISAPRSIVANDGEAVRALLENGMGIGIQSLWLASKFLKDGTLVRLLPDHPLATDSDIWTLYPSNRIVAPKVRAMIDFLLERFHPVPPWEAR